MELNDDEKDSVEKRKMKYKKQVLLQLAYECINVLWSIMVIGDCLQRKQFCLCR